MIFADMELFVYLCPKYTIMKNYTFRYLLVSVMLMMVTAGYAYDFKVGDIYYKITSSTDKTCMVTWGTSNMNSYCGEVKIPASVTYNSEEYSVTAIDLFTFYYCSELKYVEIPASVKSIKGYAFNNCPSLSTIVDLSVNPQTISNNTFSSTNATIHVPNGYADTYKSSENWKSFTIIEDMINYTIGDVDNNGLVNSDDVSFLRNYLLTKNTTLYNTFASDVNGDEKIDISDLACLIGILNGKYNTSDTNMDVNGGTSVIPSWGRPNEDPSSPTEDETEF